MIESVLALDSHTEGEPTRVVYEGFPALDGDSIQEAVRCFETRFEPCRRALLAEPRGSEILVGALLVPPTDPSCQYAVIFFNNAKVLGMCGHGTIGLIESMRYLYKIPPDTYRIETPAGIVEATLLSDGRVSITNVPSYLHICDAELSVHGQKCRGDVAYGGNWFFLVKEPSFPLVYENRDEYAGLTKSIMRALAEQGITGKGGAPIDHVELFCDSEVADSKNFVMCPGGEFDRSPCGTGTSAKLACLAASGELAPGSIWRQESLTGTVFEASYRKLGDAIIPTITGRAYVTAELKLVFDPNDPLRYGAEQ